MVLNTTLYPTADTYVNEAAPDTNYGSGLYLAARTYTVNNWRSFLKFDLSGLPAGAVISLAKLRLNCFSVNGLVGGVTDVEARRVADDSWLENDPGGITWNNQKAFGVVEDTQVPSVAVIEWDITSFAQAELAGDETVSILLKCVTEDYDEVNRLSLYRSKEHDGDDPELYIEYDIVAVGGAVSKNLLVLTL